jgi:hypothetical protein
MDYYDDDRAMYVSPYNNLDEVLQHIVSNMNIVSNNIQASWISLWHETNEKFDSMLQNDFDLVHLVGKMFSVWEDWHISVDCIVVDPKDCTTVFFNAMNDITW